LLLSCRMMRVFYNEVPINTRSFKDWTFAQILGMLITINGMNFIFHEKVRRRYLSDESEVGRETRVV